MATRASPQSADEGRVLTSAVTRVAELWGLTNERLGAILGLSPASASRLRGGRFLLEPTSKSFEAGQYLVRLFRSLDAMTGSDDRASRDWLKTSNLDLEQPPIEMLATFKGMNRVCDYVDAHRARI